MPYIFNRDHIAVSAAHYVTLRISDHHGWRDRPTAGAPTSLTLDPCTTCNGETRIRNTWVFEAELDGADVKLFANFQVLDKPVEVTLGDGHTLEALG